MGNDEQLTMPGSSTASPQPAVVEQMGLGAGRMCGPHLAHVSENLGKPYHIWDVRGWNSWSASVNSGVGGSIRYLRHSFVVKMTMVLSRVIGASENATC